MTDDCHILVVEDDPRLRERLARYLTGEGFRVTAAADAAEARTQLRAIAPDLMVLERAGEDGKARKVIPVDDARKLPEFFSKAPAISPWRVAIVDSIDDMNANAANALLKTLEEPPERGVLFLVSHAPGGLLPTIRSRCRRLRFHAWPEAETADFVRGQIGGSEEDAIRLARMSGGAPGRAVELAGRDALEVDRTAHALLASLPDVDMAAMMALGESFRGPEGMPRFSLLMARLAEQIHQMAVATADKPGADGDRWSQVWTRLNALPAEVEGVNLDRADAFWTALGELRNAARA